MEKLLTVQQVSDLMQISRSLVYKWVHYGFVPHLKLGSLIRFRESDLTKWVDKRKKSSRITYKIDVADFDQN